MLLKPRIPKRKGHHRIYIVSSPNHIGAPVEVFKTGRKDSALKFIKLAEQGGSGYVILTEKVVSFEEYVLMFDKLPPSFAAGTINKKVDVRISDYRK